MYVCQDDAWCNRIDGYPVRAELSGQSFRESAYPAFTRSVSRTSLSSSGPGGNRGHVDDPAPPFLLHPGNYILTAKHGPRQVQIQNLLPHIQRHVLELRLRIDCAGVVDENVNLTHLFLNPGKHALDFLWARKVGLDGCASRVFIHQLLGCFFAGSVINHHGRPVLSEGLDNRTANSSCPSRDQGVLPGQINFNVSFVQDILLHVLSDSFSSCISSKEPVGKELEL